MRLHNYDNFRANYAGMEQDRMGTKTSNSMNNITFRKELTAEAKKLKNAVKYHKLQY